MDASSRRSIVPGVILISLGLVFLLPTVTDVRMRELWPVFVAGPGIIFLAMGLVNRSNYGLLMPGTLLTVFGGLFFYCVFEGWYHMHSLWPVFIIAPGLGLFMLYLFGRKEKGLLISASIVSGVGLFFLGGLWDFDYFLPALLIFLGIVLLLNAKKN
ncbi:MAG: hypothetical protein HY708_06180 [Ignavibacteriae bacterium]|nr:hypothetical protein [Ignavibacteriota bacterium]